MALSGVASAAEYTLSDADLAITTNVTALQDISSITTSNAFTVAVTLDYETVKGYLLANSGTNVQFINVGTGASMSEGNRIGMTVCYSDNSAIRGTWNEATWNQGNNNGFRVGMDLGAFDSLSWSTGSIATLVMTYSYDTGTTGVFTIADDKGNVLNQIGGDFYTGLRGSNINFDSLQLHSSVTSAYVFDHVMTSAEAKALGASMAIPEPTTATLSLLALAGLAARRRRK